MTALEERMDNIRWPKNGATLFKPDRDWWNNACLDFYPLSAQLFLYSEGYKEAADIIAKHIEKERFDQDILVFPVVFLYRHYIELSLKDIIRDGYRILDESKDFPKHHNLKNLWTEARKIIEKIINDCPKDELDASQEIVFQFSMQDPISMVFRYPFNKQGKKSIDNLNKINLRNLSEIVDGLHSFLYGVSSIFGEYLDSKSGF